MKCLKIKTRSGIKCLKIVFLVPYLKDIVNYEIARIFAIIFWNKLFLNVSRQKWSINQRENLSFMFMYLTQSRRLMSSIHYLPLTIAIYELPLLFGIK